MAKSRSFDDDDDDVSVVYIAGNTLRPPPDRDTVSLCSVQSAIDVDLTGELIDGINSVKAYIREAELGDPVAQMELAKVYAETRCANECGDATVVDFVTKQAEQGNLAAQNVLGMMLQKGIGVPVSGSRAVEWFRKAAEAGHAGAQKNLAAAYDHGHGIRMDKSEAIEWYVKAAEQDNSEAKINLAVLYANGERHMADKYQEQVMRWCAEEGDYGNTDALNILGVLYQRGVGVDRDRTKAAEIFRRAADAGNAKAQKNLAVAYAEGRGVERDLAQAVEWYTKAAEQGNPAALNNLGTLYQKGMVPGCDNNEGKAVDAFQRAAARGNATAMENLAFAYSKGGPGIPRDKTKALEWFKKAADEGRPKSQLALAKMLACGQDLDEYNARVVEWCRRQAEGALSTVVSQVTLGLILERGIDGGSEDEWSLPRDESRAAYWFEKAAWAGNLIAQNRIAYMFECGVGCQKNFATAAKWYAKAAAQGDAGAQNNLARFYETGLGVPKDETRAFELYEKAAIQGNPVAQENLGVMYATGSGTERNELKAIEWTMKAAMQGNADAQYSLAKAFELGVCAEADPVRAQRWYQKASDLGHADATYDLGNLYLSHGSEHDRDKALECYRKAKDLGSVDAEQALNKLMVKNGRNPGTANDPDKAPRFVGFSRTKSIDLTSPTTVVQPMEIGSGSSSNTDPQGPSRTEPAAAINQQHTVSVPVPPSESSRGPPGPTQGIPMVRKESEDGVTRIQAGNIIREVIPEEGTSAPARCLEAGKQQHQPQQQQSQPQQISKPKPETADVQKQSHQCTHQHSNNKPTNL